MRTLLYPAALMVIICLLALYTHREANPYQRTSLVVPKIQLRYLNNVKNYTFPSQESYIIHFWASWCPSCAWEFKNNTFQRLRKSGLTVVGVNYKDTEHAAQNLLQQFNEEPFSVSIVDPEGSFGTDLGIQGAPETFLIRFGVVQRVIDHPLNKDDEEEILKWLSNG